MNTSQDPLVSPCIRVCCLDSNDICVGCFRTLDEIVGWSQMQPDARAAVLLETEKRRRRRANTEQ